MFLPFGKIQAVFFEQGSYPRPWRAVILGGKRIGNIHPGQVFIDKNGIILVDRLETKSFVPLIGPVDYMAGERFEIPVCLFNHPSVLGDMLGEKQGNPMVQIIVTAQGMLQS